jgi:hypothetical protein
MIFPSLGKKWVRSFQALETFTALLLSAMVSAWAGESEFKTERFRFILGSEGRPVSLRAWPGGEELLNLRSPGAGFYLEGADHRRTELGIVAGGAEGRLTLQSADGSQTVVCRVRAADRYLVLRIEKLDGCPAPHGTALRFEANGSARMRVTELDYMTRVQNEPYGVRVHWDDIWQRAPGEPPGGLALFVRQDEADEDETLLHIWVQEKLPHPKVQGEWTLGRARAWVDEWQKLFADRSQMILEGGSLDELCAGLTWAEQAKIKEIYLFTQTWRTDNFWPGNNGNLHVNRKIFSRGEEDLRAFSDLVQGKGMRLNLHYVSGGIGLRDPVYVGAKPDRRLAGWVRGTLAKAATSADTELVFRPAAGASYPPALPEFFHHNHVRVADEIVRVGSFEPLADGTWRLHQCRRGQSDARPAAHAAGTEAQGLVVAYGQNYVPDNHSSLLDEMARNYALFLNRCGIAHSEYDGAEIHCYNGNWGYRKFATRVYEKLDRPVTAHDSSGRAPRCNFEYRFNSTRKLLAGTCPFTHGNWSAPVQLASPSRVASTLLDANFVLSQGHRGGALGLCKPEPMFAVSDKTLKAHGLSSRLIETLLNWKAVSALLTDEQRAKLDGSFGKTTSRMPERSQHAASRFVQTVRKSADGYQIVPVCVLTRKYGDILWQQGQEHGAISPRQYVKPGEELLLENPFAAQPAQFIIRVLWAFASRGPSVTLKEAGKNPVAHARPAELFTAGNEGGNMAQTGGAPNLLLQPTLGQLRLSADAPLKHVITEEGRALCIQAENQGTNELWADVRRLPEWSTPMDLTGRRGIGLRVTGDGSGALLLFMIAGRDYVVPIDFQGPRDIEIPNGEVAWSSGQWGWRMDTKHTDYARQRWCRVGFGRLPPRSKAAVRIEALAALAESLATLDKPVIRAGSGTLTVQGSIASGEYLHYAGGSVATVLDENWNRLRELPVEQKDYVMPTGWAAVSVTSAGTHTKPWLEIQCLTEDKPMPVPAR